MVPSAGLEAFEPDLSTKHTPDEQVIDGLHVLVAQGARTIVSEAMVS
jgi:hypothetical protein